MAKKRLDASPITRREGVQDRDVEPGEASILARRKAQRSNSENAIVDNGEKGEEKKEEIVRERRKSKNFSREATGQRETSPPENAGERRQTPDQNGWTHVTGAIHLAMARREKMNRPSVDNHERRAAA